MIELIDSMAKEYSVMSGFFNNFVQFGDFQ